MTYVLETGIINHLEDKNYENLHQLDKRKIQNERFEELAKNINNKKGVITFSNQSVYMFDGKGGVLRTRAEAPLCQAMQVPCRPNEIRFINVPVVSPLFDGKNKPIGFYSRVASGTMSRNTALNLATAIKDNPKILFYPLQGPFTKGGTSVTCRTPNYTAILKAIAGVETLPKRYSFKSQIRYLQVLLPATSHEACRIEVLIEGEKGVRTGDKVNYAFVHQNGAERFFNPDESTSEEDEDENKNFTVWDCSLVKLLDPVGSTIGYRVGEAFEVERLSSQQIENKRAFSEQCKALKVKPGIYSNV
jgi:hypothetical protein